MNNKNIPLKNGSFPFGYVLCWIFTGILFSVFAQSAYAQPYVYESQPNTAIVDQACVTSIVNVPATFSVNDLKVGVNLSHTYRSDLSITLTSPFGNSVQLFTKHGSSSDNLDILLDDSAPSPISNSGTSPHNISSPFYEHRYSPNTPLSNFDGQPAKGNWVLRVCDAYNADSGTVYRVKLEFDGSPGSSGSGPSTLYGNGPRSFIERKTSEFKGNFEYVGNTLLHCVSGCTTNNHNASPMSYVDIDGDTSTFNSSSADITLPANAEVTWAGLYWGGTAGINTSTWSGINSAPNVSNKQKLKFKVPGGSYESLTANQIDTISNDPTSGWSTYQAYADVTDLVKAAGGGEYAVADVQLDSGGGYNSSFTNPNGGWNLVVFYKSDTEQYRHITIWDGFDFIYFSDANNNFTVNSIRTPPSGAFETEVAFMCFDGEEHTTYGAGYGDFLAIGNTSQKLTNGLNPSTNVCNGSISKSGNNVTTRNPSYTQNWAFDVDRFSFNNMVPNNANSVTAIFGSDNEGIWFGNLVLSTELFTPPQATKSFATAILPAVTPTDMTITLSNPNISGTLQNVAFSDAYPTGLTNVAGSVIKSNSCGGSLTANSNASSLSFSGGSLNAGASCSIVVSVVAAESTIGSTLENCTSEITSSSTDSVGESACASVEIADSSATTTDFGDAPASYGDASHTTVSGLYLGLTPPDAEDASQHSYNAYGDGEQVVDGSGTWYLSGDEDGAPAQPVLQHGTYIPVFPVLKMTAMTYSADFTVTNSIGSNAKLFGWIDFDGNGSFDANEAASVNVVNGSAQSIVTLSWNVPIDIQLGTTFIRLRLTSDSTVTTSTPTGDASNGEVEDFVLAVAMDIPPDSNNVTVINGETPLACQSIVFEDDFDDVSVGNSVMLGPNRGAGGGAVIPLRDWTVAGGGSDTYARVHDASNFSIGSLNYNMGSAIYLGNGAVRRISPAVGTGFTFDAEGRLTSTIDAIELRDAPDDTTPGTTGMGWGTEAHWGPQPVSLSRTFPTVAGKVYRLYFKAIPEDIGGSFVPGVMRVDVPGGGVHFKIPASNESITSYAIEFTASSTTSTVSFVNYGHVNSGSSGWCDPASEYNNNPWCTVGGGDQHGNELILDEIIVAESICGSGNISGLVYSDVNGNDTYDVASESGLASITVSVYDDKGTVSDTSDDVLVLSTSSASDGSYTLNDLSSALSYRLEVDGTDSDLPEGSTVGTPNPLTGISVSSDSTLENQNFGFDPLVLSCPVDQVAADTSGTAVTVTLDQGVAYEFRALGDLATEGTTLNSANSALLARNDSLILDLGEMAAGSSELVISLGRNANGGRLRIETSADNSAYVNHGTYGSGGTLGQGVVDKSNYLNLRLPANGARYVRFVREASSVWLDGVSFDTACAGLGVISGHVYIDGNSNNVFDVATESTLASIAVSLFNDVDGSLISTTSSAGNGGYLFEDVPVTRNYRISVDATDEDLPPGADVGTSNPLTGVTVSVGNTTTDQNFGFDVGTDYGDAPASYGTPAHHDVGSDSVAALPDEIVGEAQSVLFLPGSYIVDMGVLPQTIENGLKPYGLVHELVVNHKIPVFWSISPTKVKDGVDFIHDGRSYRGGSFIIPVEYVSSAVVSTINTWKNKGVVVDGPTISEVNAPIHNVINGFPRAVLDSDKGDIIEDAFYLKAEVPSSSYRSGGPDAINSCDDVFILPHADPEQWSFNTAANFQSFITNGGYLWSGCSAVSGLENPSDGLGEFLLSNGGLVWADDHGDPERSGGSSNPGDPNNFSYAENSASDAYMQFMGTLDNALEGGSEEVYLPLSNGWRDETKVAVWDPDHSDIPGLSPGKAALVAYGAAHGNQNYGQVLYESSHDIGKNGSEAEQVAAARIIGNFLLQTAIDKRVGITDTSMPSTMVQNNSYPVSVTAPDAVSYAWNSSCGGSFSPNTNTASVTFTMPQVTTVETCMIRVEVMDNCGRRNMRVRVIDVVDEFRSGLSGTRSLTKSATISGLRNTSGSVSSIYLGSIPPDSDSAIASGAGADSDDITGIDDEDAFEQMPYLDEEATSYFLNVPLVNASGGDAYLHAWIDFDGDGNFEASEHQTTVIASGATSGNLTWGGLSGLTVGDTYTRFRVTTSVLSDNATTTSVDERAVSASNDGEVEDHVLSISPIVVIPPTPTNNPGTCWAIDDGTANIYKFTPDTASPQPPTLIPTSRVNSGEGLAWRPSTNELFMWDGTTTYVVNAETGSDVRSFTANFSPGTHVEGAAFYVNPSTLEEELWLTVESYINSDKRNDRYLVRIDPNNGANISSAGPMMGGYINPGVEYGKDTGGLSIDPNSKQFWVTNDGLERGLYPMNGTTARVGAGKTFSPSVVDAEGLAFANDGYLYTESDEGPSTDRYIWQVNASTGNIIRAAGPFPGSGDVEGLACDGGASHFQSDHSDIPLSSTSYGDAEHKIRSDVRLGAVVTSEYSAYDSSNADGDADDGVVIPELAQSMSATITVAVNGTGGYLQAWFDWNGDGDFADAAEQVAVNLQDNGAGSDIAAADGMLTFDVIPPANASTTQTFARFRWSTMGGLDSTSNAADGEVEDYAVLIKSAKPFVCTGDLYHVISKQFHKYNLSTGQYDAIGTAVDFEYSIGYRESDNLIYGIVTGDAGGTDSYGASVAVGDIVRVDAEGMVSRVSGTNTPLDNNHNAADIHQGRGTLWVRNGTKTTLSEVNISSGTILQTLTLSGGAEINGEIVIVGDVAYRWLGGLLHRIQLPASGGGVATTSSAAISGVGSTMSGAGAAFGFDDPDNPGTTVIYWPEQNTGDLYKISDLNSANPKAVKVADTPSSSENDGASCPSGVAPFNVFAISGRVFEDLEYGGGPGRAFGTAGTAELVGATIELYDTDGNYLSQTISAADGSYQLPGLENGNYYLRVVSDSVDSGRAGSDGSEIPVMTYRSNGITAITNEVGGRHPTLSDAGSNSGISRLHTSSFTFNGGNLDGQPAQAVQPVTLSGGFIQNANIGFNFNTIVNRNDEGQGSLRQFVINNNLLSSEGIQQQLSALVAADYTTGDTIAVFMIPVNQLNTSDEAIINITRTLNVDQAQVVIDGRVQEANRGSGTIILKGDSSGLLNGVHFTEKSDGSTLRDVSIKLFGGSGIIVSGAGSGTGEGVHIEQVLIQSNGQYGILLQNDATHAHVISNTLSDNTWAGIANDANANNTFSQNSLSNNGGLGIDLEADGVTVNSNSDTWLNYPELAGGSISSNGTRIVAYDFDLEVPANTHGYRVEFFSNTTVDPSGHGEGLTYLGYEDIASTGNGLKNFKGTINANQTVAEDANIAVTVIEKTGVTTLGATSEFSGIRNGGVSVCTDLLSNPDPNAPLPTITIDENSGEVSYLEASDANGNPITYVISGGADADKFVIHPVPPDALFDCLTIEFIKDNDGTIGTRNLAVTSGNRVVLPTPLPGNYEAPVDNGQDNTYDLSITATDSEGNHVTRPLSIVVTDVNEKPVITSSGSITFTERNNSVVVDLEAYDPDEGDAEGSGLIYSIAGGEDAGLFSIAPYTGALSFITAPDFDSPADKDGDNRYQLTARVSDDQGYADSKNLVIIVSDDPDNNGIQISVKALLQGAYNSTDGLMQDALRSNGLLPVVQPYTGAAFNYAGTEQINLGLVSLEGNNAMVDWVLLELRAAHDKNQLIARQALLIQRDGDLMDAASGAVTLDFPAVGSGEYYVSLRHRNHLDVLTATPVMLGSDAINVIDFSQPGTPARGQHSRYIYGEATALLWSGDINQDQQLILDGQGSDINLILSDILTDSANDTYNSSYQVTGYRDTDLNMDGVTLFMGPANDANILMGNIITHPDNEVFISNFLVEGGLR